MARRNAIYGAVGLKMMHLFGICRERITKDGEKPAPQGKHNVRLRKPPVRRGFRSGYPDMSVSAVVPEDIQAEPRDKYHYPIEING